MGNFAMIGIEVETIPDGSFNLRQDKCVDPLERMSPPQRRSRADTGELTSESVLGKLVGTSQLILISA